MTIALTEDIDPTEDDIAAAQLPEAIGNANGTKLTLNLETYKLALPMTMMMDNSELIITGTTGSITADDLMETNADLISASSGVTLSGGSIVVPTDYTGISGDVEMTGGSVVVNGGIGIASAVSSTLSGGTITINEGIGIEGGSGITSLEGTGFTVNGGTGVNSSVGTIEMIDCMMNVYEGKGISSSSEVVVSGGSIYINDTVDNDTDSIGIEGLGGSISLEEGTTITAEGSSAVAVYADSAEGGQEGGTVVELDRKAIVRATVEINVFVLEPAEFGFYTEYDGELYFCLKVEPFEVTDEGTFSEAVDAVNSGENVFAQLSADVVLTDEYTIGDSDAPGTMDIDLNENDLILQMTMINRTTLDISGAGNVYAEDGYGASPIIMNEGVMTWNEAGITLTDGQTGILNAGTFTMNSGSITAPVDADELSTFAVQESETTVTTTISDTVVVTGTLTKIKASES
ncbi:MAG: hypothetical protein IJF29_01845 [Firmicutes bacterium]|nr:hypothetical protein [Bacillota bacterium]